jgi:hypothetical protein
MAARDEPDDRKANDIGLADKGARDVGLETADQIERCDHAIHTTLHTTLATERPHKSRGRIRQIVARLVVAGGAAIG